MNAIVCFSVALPLGRFPHWRSLSFCLGPPLALWQDPQEKRLGVYTCLLGNQASMGLGTLQDALASLHQAGDLPTFQQADTVLGRAGCVWGAGSAPGQSPQKPGARAVTSLTEEAGIDFSLSTPLERAATWEGVGGGYIIGYWWVCPERAGSGGETAGATCLPGPSPSSPRWGHRSFPPTPSPPLRRGPAPPCTWGTEASWSQALFTSRLSSPLGTGQGIFS